MTILQVIAPFAGAIALETVHWYQLREKSQTAAFKRAIRSVEYWVITLAMIVVGGAGALIYLGERLNAAELFIAGAAFPTLLTKIISAFVKKQTALGSREDSSIATEPSLSGFFGA
jgi:hypothetical protein